MAKKDKMEVAINLRLPAELVDALDERRRAEPDLPTRQEQIRRLLHEALTPRTPAAPAPAKRRAPR